MHQTILTEKQTVTINIKSLYKKLQEMTNISNKPFRLSYAVDIFASFPLKQLENLCIAGTSDYIPIQHMEYLTFLVLLQL